jgi:uncharacterized DUF497 family protein
LTARLICCRIIIVTIVPKKEQTMRIEDLTWKDEYTEKIIEKHGVHPEEVEEVFAGRPKFRRGHKGKRLGEDLYYALGRTEAGRYLFVVFIWKKDRRALILSARDMNRAERKWFERK